MTTMYQGMTGAEERMGLVWSKAVKGEKMEPTRFVEVTLKIMIVMAMVTINYKCHEQS